MNLEEFRKKVTEYRRAVGYQQKDLAAAMGLHRNVLSNKLNGTANSRLTQLEVKQIITLLAEWHALSSVGEVHYLLHLLNLKPAIFSSQEWHTPPLQQLDSLNQIESEPVAITLSKALMVPPTAEVANLAADNLANASPWLASSRALTDKTVSLATNKKTTDYTSPPLDLVPAMVLTTPHNLLASLTSFVGREKDLQLLTSLLRRADVRLVTLCGTGGVGKTRLAQQVAAYLLGDFADGVFLVALSSIQEISLVPNVIARTLGLKENRESKSLVESLKNYLQHKQILLILDNFEHLLDAAQFINELLVTVGTLKILVTSREILNLYGEYEYILQPLPLPDLEQVANYTYDKLSSYAALNIFVQRSQAVRPDFKLTEETTRLVVEICRRLDGLPLALELAAACLKRLSLQELLHQLENHSLNVLVHHARNLPARHQTLRNTLEWSYNLLQTEEKTLLMQVSLFGSSFTVEVVEAIFAPAFKAEGINALAEKNLLQLPLDRVLDPITAGTARYTMLQTIREFAQELLATRPEVLQWYQQYLSYYVNLAEKSEKDLKELADQSPTLSWLDQEYPNFRTALKIAIESKELALFCRITSALTPFWLSRGYLSEASYWLKYPTLPDLLAGLQENRQLDSRQTEFPTDALLARLLRMQGLIAFNQGDLNQAQHLYQQNLELCYTLKDHAGIAEALTDLGSLSYQRGDYDTAEALHYQSLAIYQALGDKLGTSQSLTNLGNIRAIKDDYSKARSIYEAALLIYRELGNQQAIAKLLHNLSLTLAKQGDYPKAKTYIQESQLLRTKLGDKIQLVYGANVLADIEIKQGDYYTAQIILKDSLAVIRQLGHKILLAKTLYGLAITARRLHDYKRAKLWGEEALQVARELGNKLVIAEGLNNLGNIEMELENYTLARYYYKESFLLFQQIETKQGVIANIMSLAELAARQANLGQATTLFSAAESLRQKASLSLWAADLAGYQERLMMLKSSLEEETFIKLWDSANQLDLTQIYDLLTLQ